MARKKLPEGQGRVPLQVRVKETTKRFLQSLGQKNEGHAVDLLVDMVPKQPGKQAGATK